MLEELVMKIQNGEDLTAELWERVRRFVAYKAIKRYQYVPDVGAVDVDDLIQQGYIGMLTAVEDFDPEKGSFKACLALHLQTAFNEACGCRSERQMRDPIHHAKSLDTPIDEADPDGDTFLDFVPAAGDLEEYVADKVYNDQLHDRIENLLSRLSAAAADVIRSLYFDGESIDSIAKRYGTSAQNMNGRRSGYLMSLRSAARSTPEGKDLQRYLDENTNFYLAVGPNTFQSTHESAVERLTFRRDYLERKYGGHYVRGKVQNTEKELPTGCHY